MSGIARSLGSRSRPPYRCLQYEELVGGGRGPGARVCGTENWWGEGGARERGFAVRRTGGGREGPGREGLKYEELVGGGRGLGARVCSRKNWWGEGGA